MFRLGFLTAYLDESIIINRYADQYVSGAQNMGIDASVLECVAVQDERFWVRLRAVSYTHLTLPTILLV